VSVTSLAIGSYTAANGGRGDGVTLCSFDPASGAIAVLDVLELASPSWLEWHPSLPLLYAASEVERGAVSVLSVQDGRLRLAGTMDTGGSYPCHLAISPDGRRLYAANYGSGSLSAFELDRSGAIAARTALVQHQGSGPDADRQDGPHVHMAVLSGAQPAEVEPPREGYIAGELVCAVDLGTDQLCSYRITGAGLIAAAVTSLPPGTGPRQLLRAPLAGRAYLVAELTGQLLTLDETGPGSFEVVGANQASAEPIRNLPAQLSLSADGGLGYLSNRYPDTIAVFELAGPSPSLIAEYPVGPGWPRHFAVTGDWLISANQHGDELTVFALTDNGRRLEATGWLAVNSPTCVAIGSHPSDQ
jgi:6-phosphogluconolactonase (cycloisomerase 2 family)